MNHITSPEHLGAITHEDLSEAVRSTAMLADVSISLWGAERTDRNIMAQIKATNNASGNIGRVIKNMLAGADEPLKVVRGAFTAVRSQHYALTLPWVSDPHAERQKGPRLLPTMLFERYLAEMSKRKRAANQALDKFVAEYPDLCVAAQANLGGLVKPEEYPDASDVRASFHVSFDFEPIPAGQAFRGLPGHMIEKLSEGLRKKQDRMIDSARQAMWDQARERIEHIVGKLVDTDALFKSVTVENVRELITLLPGWNVAGDPRVDEIVADIDSMLAGVDAAELRKQPSLRAVVATQAQSVIEKMSQWGL